MIETNKIFTYFAMMLIVIGTLSLRINIKLINSYFVFRYITIKLFMEISGVEVRMNYATMELCIHPLIILEQYSTTYY